MRKPDTPVRASKKPDWLRIRIPGGEKVRKVSRVLSENKLHTVCEEARCPNKGECWGCGTATFMILGASCTRNCRFCGVNTSRKGDPVDPREPERLADAVEQLGLRYVVFTSVDRDDLPDLGASHFAECVGAVKKRVSGILTEVLIPDYRNGELKRVAEAGPDVIAHNIETVRRLQSVRDARASYELSLRTLAEAKTFGTAVLTKSSILLGLGETEEELEEAMGDLRRAGCDILVMGQYLHPSVRQVPVEAYIPPDRFEELGQKARRLGFKQVVSAPFARTSYHAEKAFSTGGKR